MKKIILATLLTLGLASCSNENSSEDINPTSKTSVIAKIAVGEEAFPTAQGKNVNRGSIPTTIDRITVDVQNSNSSVPPTQTIFDLVANGTPGAENIFYIDDVTSGMNTFLAKAYTISAPAVSTTTYDVIDENTTNARLNAEKAKVPYAFYQSTIVKNIVLGTPQEISFPLSTLNGRIIALVESGSTLSAMNRKVEVQGSRTKEGGEIINQATIDITGTKSSLTYWSDVLSVKGAYLEYTVKIYNEAGDTVEKTYTKKIIVRESTGITSKMTVNYEGITEDINYGTFTLPPWTEENE